MFSVPSLLIQHHMLLRKSENVIKMQDVGSESRIQRARVLKFPLYKLEVVLATASTSSHPQTEPLPSLALSLSLSCLIQQHFKISD